MSNTARTFEASRTARNLAKAELDAKLGLVRDDVSARSVGGRVKDTVVDHAADMAFEVADIAWENRRIVAGTVLALIIWIFRNPLMAWISELVALAGRWKDKFNG